MYADHKLGNNSAKTMIAKNYCRLCFTLNARECVRVSSTSQAQVKEKEEKEAC